MELDEYGLRLEPKHARRNLDRRKRHEYVWWYEERGGITVCTGAGDGVTYAWIPLRDLEEYVRRAEGGE